MNTKASLKRLKLCIYHNPLFPFSLETFKINSIFHSQRLLARQLYITDFGKEVVESSQNILNEVELLNQKLTTFNGQIAGKLKLSVVSTAKYIMPYFLTDFLKDNPAVELKMDVTNKSTVVRSLEKNEVDFSLVSIPPERLALNHITLMQNKLFLVGNAQSELSVLKTSFTQKYWRKLTLFSENKGQVLAKQ